MVNLDHNFFQLVNYAMEFLIQEPTYKAGVGNFHPPFKEIGKYFLHEEVNCNKEILHVGKTVFEPETVSNFHISVTETTEIKKCVVNQHQNPAEDMAVDPNFWDTYSVTEINQCPHEVPHKPVLAPTAEMPTHQHI